MRVSNILLYITMFLVVTHNDSSNLLITGILIEDVGVLGVGNPKKRSWYERTVRFSKLVNFVSSIIQEELSLPIRRLFAFRYAMISKLEQKP